MITCKSGKVERLINCKHRSDPHGPLVRKPPGHVSRKFVPERVSKQLHVGISGTKISKTHKSDQILWHFRVQLVHLWYKLICPMCPGTNLDTLQVWRMEFDQWSIEWITEKKRCCGTNWTGTKLVPLNFSTINHICTKSWYKFLT